MNGGRWVRVLARSVIVTLIVMTALPHAAGAGSPGGGDDGASAAAAPPGSQDLRTLDERQAEVAARVPEFGGMFIGDEPAPTLHVHVTGRRPGLMADLRHALAELFPDEDLPARIKLIDADFSFTQLKNWKDKAVGVATVDGVTRLDIDDRTNRLVIGVAPGSGGNANDDVEAELAAQAIPPQGWRIDTIEGSGEDATLDDEHRPITAGVRIAFATSSGSVGGCTYGLTAVRNGVAGFITNSHCSFSRGNVDSGRYYQPNPNGALPASNYFAVEAVDPPYFAGGPCGSTPSCRRSDSMFARSIGTVNLRHSIAQPPVGSFTWDGSTRYYVTGSAGALVGDFVHMVGQNSGHQTGRVDATDYVDVAGDGFVYIDQVSATYSRMRGDSGAPVFKARSCPDVNTSNGGLCATVLGIHRGTSDTGGAFSPIGAIRAELGGTIRLCISGFEC